MRISLLRRAFHLPDPRCMSCSPLRGTDRVDYGEDSYTIADAFLIDGASAPIRVRAPCVHHPQRACGIDAHFVRLWARAGDYAVHRPGPTPTKAPTHPPSHPIFVCGIAFREIGYVLWARAGYYADHRPGPTRWHPGHDPPSPPPTLGITVPGFGQDSTFWSMQGAG